MILCFNQPFATGICRGLYPAIYTDLPIVSKPQRAYIYSLEKFRKVTDYPIEWHQENFNYRIFGNMPEDSELPTNALLGFVDIYGPDPAAQGAIFGETVYRVRNAHEFVAPFEVEPDEIAKYDDLIKQLNTQMFVPRVPYVCSNFSELVIPANAMLESLCRHGYDFNLELSPSIAKLVIDNHGELRPFKKFTIWYGDWANSYLMDDETKIFFRNKEEMELLKRCPRIYSVTENRVGARIHFSCHHPLFD